MVRDKKWQIKKLIREKFDGKKEEREAIIFDDEDSKIAQA